MLPLYGFKEVKADSCDRGKFDPRSSDCRESVEKRRAEDKKLKPLEPLVYPMVTGNFPMADPISGKQLMFVLSSKDGSELVHDFVGNTRPPIVIKPLEIVSWKSFVAGQGSDNSAAISTAVSGALFFWPMMLAAPFMVQNYTITGFDVSYIDEYGKDTVLNFVTTMDPVPAIALLKFSTGLDSGLSRGADVNRSLYEVGLKNMLIRLQGEKNKIIVKNTKKPWCSYVNLSNKTTEVKDYEQSVLHVKSLYQKLGLGEFNDSNNQSTSDQWEQYLRSNLGMAQWAKAFPQQATVLKNCS